MFLSWCYKIVAVAAAAAAADIYSSKIMMNNGNATTILRKLSMQMRILLLSLRLTP
jgi:hypothetical protein